MRKLPIVFLAALPLVAQTSVHLYDTNATVAFGAPASGVNCSGVLSGLSGIVTPSGALTTFPVSQPITISGGIIDAWTLPSLGGTSYSLNVTCSYAGQQFTIPAQTMVVPAPTPNALTITAATTPSGNPWSTVLTVSSGFLSPWSVGQAAYLSSNANPQFTGGYTVTAVGSSSITATAATAPAASGGATLQPIPTSPWSGSGALQSAGPVNLQAVLTNVTPTPNQQFAPSQMSSGGCVLGQLLIFGGFNWNCGNPLFNPMTTAGDVIVGGSGGAATRLGLGTGLLENCGGALGYTNAVCISLPNDATTAPVAGKFAVWNQAGTGLTVATTTSPPTSVVGVCLYNCVTGGNSIVVVVGQTTVSFDGATTAFDYITLSGATGGDASDVGSALPSGSLGQVLSTNASAGTYAVNLTISGSGLPAIPNVTGLNASSNITAGGNISAGGNLYAGTGGVAVESGTYQSGGTGWGTGTCTLTATNGGGTGAIFTITVSGSAPSVGAALAVASGGLYTIPGPTIATGPSPCGTGNITISTLLFPGQIVLTDGMGNAMGWSAPPSGVAVVLNLPATADTAGAILGADGAHNTEWLTALPSGIQKSITQVGTLTGLHIALSSAATSVVVQAAPSLSQAPFYVADSTGAAHFTVDDNFDVEMGTVLVGVWNGTALGPSYVPSIGNLTGYPLSNPGDVFMGGTAGAPSVLPDVATGSVLASGGVNTAPGYTTTLPSTVQGNITQVGTLAQSGFRVNLASGSAVVQAPASPTIAPFFIANSGGTSQWSIDKNYITTTHGLYGSGPAPSIVCGTGAGATPPTGAACAVSGSDISGTITITPTSGPVAGGTVATITMGNIHTAAPQVCILQIIGVPLASNLSPYVPLAGEPTGTNTPVWYFVANGTNPLVASTNYNWAYACF